MQVTAIRTTSCTCQHTLAGTILCAICTQRQLQNLLERIPSLHLIAEEEALLSTAISSQLASYDAQPDLPTEHREESFLPDHIQALERHRQLRIPGWSIGLAKPTVEDVPLRGIVLYNRAHHVFLKPTEAREIISLLLLLLTELESTPGA